MTKNVYRVMDYGTRQNRCEEEISLAGKATDKHHARFVAKWTASYRPGHEIAVERFNPESPFEPDFESTYDFITHPLAEKRTVSQIELWLKGSSPGGIHDIEGILKEEFGQGIAVLGNKDITYVNFTTSKPVNEAIRAIGLNLPKEADYHIKEREIRELNFYESKKGM